MSEIAETNRKGFKDLSSLNIPTAVKEGMKPTALVLVGLWAGRQVALQLKKVSNTPTVQGFLGKGFMGIEFNKAIPAVGTALLGLTVAQLSKNKDFKLLGWGAAAAGVATGAMDFFGKDILNGVDDKTRLPDYRDEKIMFKGTTNLDEALPEIEEAMELIENSVHEDEPEIEGVTTESPAYFEQNITSEPPKNDRQVAYIAGESDDEEETEIY